MGWSVGDVLPRRDGLSIWKILKKIQLRSDHGVKMLGSDHGMKMLRSDHGVEKLRLDHAGRQLSEDELRSKTPRDVPNVGGDISIVWYERLLKIVSLSSCRRTGARSY